MHKGAVEKEKLTEVKKDSVYVIEVSTAFHTAFAFTLESGIIAVQRGSHVTIEEAIQNYYENLSCDCGVDIKYSIVKKFIMFDYKQDISIGLRTTVQHYMDTLQTVEGFKKETSFYDLIDVIREKEPKYFK